MNTVLNEEQIFEAQGRTKCTSIVMAEHLVTAQKQDAYTRLELAKVVREMSPINAVGFQQAVLKLLDGTK